MSDRAKMAGPDGGLKLRSPLVVVVAPVIFVTFGLFLPIADQLGLSLAVRIGVPLLLAGVGVVTSLVDRSLARLRIGGMAAGVREFVLLLAGSALVMWALLRRPAVELIRSGELWIGLAGATLVWLSGGLFRRSLARREFFLAAVLRSVQEKPQSRRSTGALLAATRDFSVEAGEAEAAMDTVRRWMVAFLVWYLGALLLLVWALGVATPVEQTGLCVSAAVTLFGLTTLGRMSEEQHLIMEGLLPSRRGALLVASLSVGLFGVCGLLALLAAWRPAAVSQSALAAALAWIATFLARIPSPQARPIPPSSFRPMVPQHFALSGQLRNLPAASGSELLGKILTYLGWSLLALLAAGLLWMLVAPLFRLRRGHIDARTLMRRTWRHAVRSFVVVLGRLLEGVSLLIGLRGQGREAASAVTGGGSVGEHRQRRVRRRSRLLASLFGGPNRRFLRAFYQLVHWGERQGVAFSKSTAPCEFVEQVAVRMPELRGELAEIASLFEEHLFAPHPLSQDRLAAYYRKIGEVLHYGHA